MLEKLIEAENTLIREFISHQVFSDITLMEWDLFLKILIQRKFLSKSLINLYEEAIELVTDEEIKCTIRSLIKEEFPRRSKDDPLPSHRELLYQDLINLGATRTQILTTPKSVMTATTIDKCLKLLGEDFDRPNFQLGTVAALRFMAEVLVAEEYKCFWDRKISQKLSSTIGDSQPRSQFYWFHIIHDDRGQEFSGDEKLTGGESHSQQLARHIKARISSPEDVYYCIAIEQRVVEIKSDFYNQFL
jgi:hypothetical protein